MVRPLRVAEGVDGVQLADLVGDLRGEGRGVEAGEVAVGGQGAELPGEGAVDEVGEGERVLVPRMGEAHGADLAGPGEDVPEQVPVGCLEAVRRQQERWGVGRALARVGVFGEAQQGRVGEAEPVPEGESAGVDVGIVDWPTCHRVPA